MISSSIKSMTQKEFIFFRELIYKEAGISLGNDKKTLVESRLLRLLKTYKLPSFNNLIEDLQSNGFQKTEFIDALTTNLTEFFRESAHFEHLVKICIEEYSNKRMNIWSAACSTGEEVYSLAMVLEELRQNNGAFDYRIIGSDIDSQVLKKSEAGIYNSESIETVSPQLLKNYFQSNTERSLFKVKDIIKNKVKFRTHNLMVADNKLPIHFDIIFLRNVLIYFNEEDRLKVIEKMYTQLKPGGLLYVGHSETIGKFNKPFKKESTSVYRKL